MDAKEHFQLTLPSTKNHPAGSSAVFTNKSIVIIGANGSGKTRLGSWIEFTSPQNEKVYRVGAQRTLKMASSVSTSSIEMAEADLLYGYVDMNSGTLGNHNHKSGYRWGNEPNTFLMNDFEKLLVYLFSEDYEVSTKYRQKSKLGRTWENPPDTKLDIVKRIWEGVLPHRELIFGGGKVEVSPKGQPENKYAAGSMSDGERVAFYLIGQCLSAPKDAIIVIDEPEVHLHRIIQTALWDAIEAEREDCKFVYMTHDLDFAASKTDSKKVWLSSFDGQNWEWQEIPDDADIPEDVLLSVLGSRKPVLFIEGEKGSLDQILFSFLYKKFTIVPCGGCDRVLSSAASFGSMKHLHNLECKGIIDRDYRSDESVEYLRHKGTLVLNLSEVENFLLVEGVIRNVAAYLQRESEADQLMEKVKNMVFSEMEKDRTKLVSSIASFKIEALLKQFDNKVIGKEEIVKSIERTSALINVTNIYEAVDAEISAILDTRNYA
ncbi:MAG: DUF4435 domain-containing protein, partial [Isosphaeraceae bacterium]